MTNRNTIAKRFTQPSWATAKLPPRSATKRKKSSTRPRSTVTSSATTTASPRPKPRCRKPTRSAQPALPATTEAAVVAALDDFEAEHRTYEAVAREAGLADEAKEWLRHANAYAKAREQYEAGVRPASLGDRAYVLPSQREGGESHLLRFDGDWICSCKAGASAHWAKHLIIGIERAYEDMQRFDGDGDPSGDDCPDHGPYTDDDCPKCDAPALLDLGTRLARARIQLAA